MLRREIQRPVSTRHRIRDDIKGIGGDHGGFDGAGGQMHGVDGLRVGFHPDRGARILALRGSAQAGGSLTTMSGSSSG